jgi:D-alanyl-D-alanine carboxypeptidase/D-alanyl-D-alanine-endopeptidase (penicillin-binding protein 4)
MQPLPPLFRRRWVLGALLAGAAAPALAGAPTTSPRPRPRPGAAPQAAAAVVARPPAAPEVAALIEAARLGGQVAYAVADARTGELLEAREPGLALPPASVTKAITALYALDALGPAHRFQTRLLATGPVQGGRLEGDLVLVGGGDPGLSTDALGDLAAALARAGLRSVTGRFLVHAAALPLIPQIDPAQPPHVGYNPAVSGLNLNYNRVHFEWRRAGGAWQVGVDARGERFRPDVAMAEVRIVQREAPLFTYAAEGGRERWTVASAALGRGGSRWLPVRRPDLYAGEVFHTLARAQGITLPPVEVTTAPLRGTVLAEMQSDELGAVLRDMLRFSTNLTAEAVGLAASAALGGPVATLAESAARMTAWAAERHGLTAARFVDHSGLGDAARMAPADMVRVLVRAGPEGRLRPILRPFAMRDARGNEMRSHPLRVAAKTGTLNFVSGLGGYIAAPSGRDLAFAIFAADVARRDRLGPAERERPAGGPEWTARARRLHQQLIERWGALYG